MSNEESSHELARLESQISSVSKQINDLSTSVAQIYTILAENRGANIPVRVGLLESKVSDIENVQASREVTLNLIPEHTKKLENLSAFKYQVIGALVLVNSVLYVFGRFIADKLFSS